MDLPIPNDTLIYVALVIFCSIAIYLLMRSDPKSPSQGNGADVKERKPGFFRRAKTGSQPTSAAKQAATEDGETISLLEQRLAEMDAKIAQLTKPSRTPSEAAAPRNAASAATYTPTGTPTTQSPRDIRVEVYRLAEEGQTSLDIAEALGISRGEVDLLLDLRQPHA